jgi:hypothetical protein
MGPMNTTKHFHRLHNNGESVRPESPPAEESHPVIATGAVTLAGNHYDAGDVVPPEIVAKVPPKNLTALYSLAVLTTEPDIGEKELALHAQRRTTLEEVSATRDLLV